MPGLVPACRLAARPVRRARATPALVLTHGCLCASSQTLSACGVCRVLQSRERTARTPLCGRHGELPCLYRGAPCTAPRSAGDSAQWRMPRLQRRRSSSRGPHARMLGVRSRCPSGGAPCRPSAHLASPAHLIRRLDRRPDVECRRPLAPVISLSGARHASQGMSAGAAGGRNGGQGTASKAGRSGTEAVTARRRPSPATPFPGCIMELAQATTPPPHGATPRFNPTRCSPCTKNPGGHRVSARVRLWSGARPPPCSPTRRC